MFGWLISNLDLISHSTYSGFAIQISLLNRDPKPEPLLVGSFGPVIILEIGFGTGK